MLNVKITFQLKPWVDDGVCLPALSILLRAYRPPFLLNARPCAFTLRSLSAS